MSCYVDYDKTRLLGQKGNQVIQKDVDYLVPNPVYPKPFDSKIEETLMVTRHNGCNLQVLPNNFIIKYLSLIVIQHSHKSLVAIENGKKIFERDV